MPGGDGTGPGGMGPMTGRAAGFCAGFPVPGYANPVGGRGMGMGWGRGGGFGRGRGFGRGFGWARVTQGIPAGGGGVSPYAYGGAPFAPAMTAKQELADLKQQSQFLQDNLSHISERIEQLEKETQK